MMGVLNLFRRKSGKWHEVRWRSGPRQIFMTLRFATTGGDRPPAVEKLPPEPDVPETLADPAAIVEHIQAAVTEYNRMNVCALRVAGVRYQATEGTEPIDFGTATRKLLNLL